VPDPKSQLNTMVEDYQRVAINGFG
jgi:hypothetical protein